MKRIVFSFFILLVGLTVKSADFGMSSDFLATYKSKVFSMELAYDCGYSFFHKSLYVGVGPSVDAGFWDGGSSFGVGGYAKVRYIVPLNFPVKPYVLGRIGYGYNFTNNDGGLFYGFGMGVHFAKHWGVGCYCAVSTSTTTSTYSKRVVTHIGRQRGFGSQNDKTTYGWSTYTTEDTETVFTPLLILTYSF